MRRSLLLAACLLLGGLSRARAGVVSPVGGGVPVAPVWPGMIQALPPDVYSFIPMNRDGALLRGALTRLNARIELNPQTALGSLDLVRHLPIELQRRPAAFAALGSEAQAAALMKGAKAANRALDREAAALADKAAASEATPEELRRLSEIRDKDFYLSPKLRRRVGDVLSQAREAASALAGNAGAVFDGGGRSGAFGAAAAPGEDDARSDKIRRPLAKAGGNGNESLSSGGKSMPPMSSKMTELYGPGKAKQVYDRLQELDPELNSIIQKVAYDFFWARPGLDIRDKSLVTVVSLVVLRKEEQTRIHMNGFLNAGGTPEELVHVLARLSADGGAASARRGGQALAEVLAARGASKAEISAISALLEKSLGGAPAAIRRRSDLDARRKNLVDVAAAAASGSIKATKAAIVRFLKSGGTREDVRGILIHQIVYCGFPTAMNGFAALLEASL